MQRTNAFIDDTQANFRNQGVSICNLEHQVEEISKLLTKRTQGALAIAETFHESFPSLPLENCIVNGKTLGTLSDGEDIIECINNLDALPNYEFPKKFKFKELGAIHVDNNLSKKEPPKLELKQLPLHLRYAFLEDSCYYHVIINSSLNNMEEENLLRVLREHRKAIGWTIEDIKGTSSSICMHKILMEERYKPKVQPQRRLNPSMQEVVKKEVVKLLDVGICLLRKMLSQGYFTGFTFVGI
ncbi:hypothetical protein UlMin_019579 [Ulmus minor]